MKNSGGKHVWVGGTLEVKYTNKGIEGH